MSGIRILTEEEKATYTLSFVEAMKLLFENNGSNKKCFIIGTMFQKGVYLTVDKFTDTVVIKEKVNGSYQTVGPFAVSGAALYQKYKTIPLVSDEYLGLL